MVQKALDGVFLSLKVVFVLANSVDSDEMPHSAAFHLGLHCLPKNRFRVLQRVYVVYLFEVADVFHIFLFSVMFQYCTEEMKSSTTR